MIELFLLLIIYRSPSNNLFIYLMQELYESAYEILVFMSLVTIQVPCSLARAFFAGIK